MRVFVTGASGHVGAAVAAELLRAGHQVVGLARSGDAERALEAAGVAVQRGSLEEPESLRAGATQADGVIHLGFNPDFSRFRESCEADRRAIETIGAAVAGSGKPLLVPNGIAGLARRGEVVTEHHAVPGDYRFPRVSEQTALRLASEGVVASVIRLAQIHDAKKQGLVTALIGTARRSGVSAYVGEGRNRWPAAHVSDVARLFRFALEAPRAGGRYHAVGEEGVEVRVIAEAISRTLGIPARSLTPEQARGHFGPLSMFVGEDMPATATATREELGWQPTGPTLLAELGHVRPS